MSKSETEVLARFNKRTTSSYAKVKETEAKVGGRTLPLGLEGAIGQFSGTKIGENKSGKAYLYLYSSVLEPEDCNGIANGFYLPMEADDYNSEEDNQMKIVGMLKLLGFSKEIDEHSDFVTMLSDVCEKIEQGKPTYEFNVGKKARNNGDVTCFIQGPTEAGYLPPELQGDNEHTETHEEKPKGRTVKKKPTTKGVSQEAAFAESDSVISTNNHFKDGNDYEGIIDTIDGDTATVTFSDGETAVVPLTNLINQT